MDADLICMADAYACLVNTVPWKIEHPSAGLGWFVREDVSE